MSNQDNVIDITDELKKAKGSKWKRFKEKAKNWWEINAWKVMIYGPLIAGVAAEGVKVAGKVHKAKVDERAKDRRCWDPSIGHYWELNRKLSNDDWRYINEKHAEGQSIGKLLDDLHALK